MRSKLNEMKKGRGREGGQRESAVRRLYSTKVNPRDHVYGLQALCVSV